MIFLFCVFAFLGGSIPFGLLIAKYLCRVDPREVGSKNTGATNIARTCGFGYGVLTLAFDLGKGALAAWAGSLAGLSPFWQAMLGLAAVLGHMYSPFMGGKGGKGVATSLGFFLFLAPWATLWAVPACITVIWISGYVSLGSLLLVSLVPALTLLQGKWVFLPAMCLTMLCVFHKHRENISRLIQGQEHPWRKKYFADSAMEQTKKYHK